MSAASFGLRSPWDLLATRDGLVVALAGSHQIALFDPERGTIRRLAGNGREARVDGALADASFAQPSALATDGNEIFVLDSESSSVRAIDVKKGQVRTVVGKDLFEFGDVDGDRERARFEHPLGLAYAAGALWVADTFNAKLKRVDLEERRDHQRARRARPIDAELMPSGLAVVNGALLVADTDHHRVLRFALPGRRRCVRIEPLLLAGLAPPNGDRPGCDVAGAGGRRSEGPRRDDRTGACRARAGDRAPRRLERAARHRRQRRGAVPRRLG